MELLAPLRTSYLLGASLRSLHVESQEWLRDINFWRNEVAYFHKLLSKRLALKDSPTDQLVTMEEELEGIGDEVDNLRKNVLSHERLLAAVLRLNSIMEEEKFSDTHRQLIVEIYSVEKLMENFKGQFFSFFQKFE